MEKDIFENLKISKEIYKAVKDMGFEETTPIQSQSIPYILEGRDIIGQALTGTGKTAAFGIPILEMIDSSSKKIQVVILCPTRELAVQIAEEIKKLAKYKRGIEIIPIYGGQSIERQINALKKGVQIIIGTPGRVMDHIERKTLKLNTTKIVILDEADEMLDMGFREDIEFILSNIPEQRQTLLFSATIPKAILDLARKYQNEPQFINVVNKELTVPTIEQYYFEVKEQTKPEILSRIIDKYNLKLSLVFCNTKKRVDELVENLQTRGYLADSLHGDMSQFQRDRVMSKFRKGNLEILVATDVAARGIDVENIEAVFNYDVPRDVEYYVHRIGRTARIGKHGRAFTFVVGRDIFKIKDIQRFSKTKIIAQKVPSINDITEVKTNKILEKIKTTIEEGQLEKFIPYIEKLIDEEFTSIDIAAALLKMSMGENNIEKKQDEEYPDTGAESGMVRLFINIGKKAKIQAKHIVGSIAGETGIPGKLIGAINIYDNYSFVEVPKEYADEVLLAMKNNQIKGNKINIEVANKKNK